MSELDTNIYRFIESLKYRPETYRTILKEHYNNKTTDTNNIRKKISKFVNLGWIGSGVLDGERGMKIFYSFDKEYNIFIVRNDCVSDKKLFDYYYCSNVDYGDKPKFPIFFNAFILNGDDWTPLGNVTIPVDKIYRWF